MDEPGRPSFSQRFHVVARAKAAAESAANELGSRLQREVARWQREQLVTVVEQQMTELRRAIDPKLAAFVASADQALLTLDGKDSSATSSGSLSWRMHDQGAFDVDGPDGLDILA